MSNTLSAFFAQNVPSETTEDFVVSDRFKDQDGRPIPWKLRSISEEENEQIRKSATEMIRGANGVRMPQTKSEDYIAKLAVASVVYPELKNADLQQSYGILGADKLLKKMLRSGEYAALVQKVQQLNGYDRDINDLKEEVKN